jgi:hypothetical protein
VFAAPPDLFKPRPAQTPRELRRRVVGREARAQEFRRDDCATAQEFVERARDEFYFGKFGHSDDSTRRLLAQ